MPTKLSQPNGSLDSTLKLVEQLEASERQKRRRLMAMLLAAVILIGGAIGAYIATQGFGKQAETISYLVFPAEKYREAVAYQHVEQPHHVLILTDQELGQFDTLSTLAEYQAWVANYGEAYDVESLSTSAWTTGEDLEPGTDTSEEEGETEDELEAPFRPNMRLALSGKREAGNAIRFTILPYNTDYTYVLDFGTGYKTRMKQRAIYRFDQAGSYRLTLRIRNQAGQEASITQQVQISVAEPAIDNEVIAQQGTPTPQAQPVSQVVDNTPNAPNGITASTSGTDNSPDPPSTEFGSQRNATSSQPDPANAQPIENSANPVPAAKPVLTPLKFAEVMPSYPGGSGQMFAFLRKRINYPEIARNHQIEGKIYIQIVVQPDGQHTHHKVARGIGYGCDKEALRVVKEMPKWIPGEQDGQKVPVIYTIPVTFALE